MGGRVNRASQRNVLIMRNEIPCSLQEPAETSWPDCLPPEQSFDQGLSRRAEMLGDGTQQLRQSTDAEVLVARNRDMVLAVFERG
jgi:hypothetical protein